MKMKKIAGYILILCGLLTATGCSDNSAKKEESSSAEVSQTTSVTEAAETSETDITAVTIVSSESKAGEEDKAENVLSESEIQLLKVNKRELYDSEWSDEHGIMLVESERSSVLLGSEEAERYPELAAELNRISSEQESDMKDEFSMLTELANEKLSYGSENFEPVVSELDAHVRRADNTVLSVLSEAYLNNGINSGYKWFEGRNYDTKTGRELLLSDVVTDIDKFAEAAQVKLISIAAKDVADCETVIKEYFEENDADEMQWTLDYNGITVYFSEGEISAAGFSTAAVTVSFAEHPDLFREKYTKAPEAYIVSFPVDSAFYTDFDGNGSCEELTVSDSYDEEAVFDATVDISVAELLHTDNFWAYDCEPYYVRTADGKNYLYLFAEQETQMYLYVYDISTEAISRVGEANVSPFYNDGISAVLIDPDSMHFDIFSTEVGTGILEGNDFFSVDTDGMPVRR